MTDSDVLTLLTPADLAGVLQVTEHQVNELRRKHSWPCVRLSHKSVRFTPEHVAQIVERHSTTASKAPSGAALGGQTKGSKSRTRAGT